MNEGEISAGLAPTSNYRYADHIGDRLFVAGQVPRDAGGNLIGADDPATLLGVTLLGHAGQLVEVDAVVTAA